MAGFLDEEGEFVVRRACLPRVTPFPSWNGVVASSRRGLVAVLSECGRVYLLRLTELDAFEFEDSLELVQVLSSDIDSVMSMCQAWTPSGDVLVVARDRQLTLYRLQDPNDDGHELLYPADGIPLRFAASSVDVLEDGDGGLLLVVGCAAGVIVFSSNSIESTPTQISTFMDDIAVAIAKFSPDGEYLAIGTTDGRVIVLRRTGQAFSTVDSADTFVKVLAAPRVTSISFAPTSDRLIATTRKGNVYVFAKNGDMWRSDESFDSLVANPKGGAMSQTLSCCWATNASNATPIFTIAGRPTSCSLELYDFHSRSLLHTLKMSIASPTNTDKAERWSTSESSDRHIMGVVCVPTSTATSPPRLLCIDSDASIYIIAWPFLTHACPR